MRNAFKLFILALLAFLVVACMPRGETISLDQSLELAKTRFAKALAANKDKLPADLTSSLDGVKTGLEKLIVVSNQEGYKQESRIIAESLRPLITKVGYATRPAFDEIVKQYVVAAEGQQADFIAGAPKLLAQRTFHLLAAEIEGTRFAL